MLPSSDVGGLGGRRFRVPRLILPSLGSTIFFFFENVHISLFAKPPSCPYLFKFNLS